VSPSAVAFSLVVAFYATAWLILVPPKPTFVSDVLSARYGGLSGVLYLVLPWCGAFGGALVGTFARTPAALRRLWPVAFCTMPVASYYYGLWMLG
jgi:hypothetical protein